jgi:hypothetical protein
MTTEITLPKGFGAVSSVFADKPFSNDELGAGVASSYAIMGFRGKVWSTKWQGKETPLMRDDGDGPRGSIEVVIVKAATAISKIYYKSGYVDGSNAAPDCWSANGLTPDASVQTKVSKTCADCPMDAWGSRTTDSGKPGKACSDSRRVSIVPLGDLENEGMGGPMLLRVPAATLKDLKAYGETLNGYGYPYYAVATRVSFDPKEAYPKLVFGAIRPLTDDEARVIVKLRDDKRTTTVLNEGSEQKAAAAPAEEASIPDSPFEQPVTPKVTAPAETPKAAPKAAAKAAPKAAPKPEPVQEQAIDDEVVDEETGEVGAAPSSFDDLLENIL